MSPPAKPGAYLTELGSGPEIWMDLQKDYELRTSADGSDILPGMEQRCEYY